MEQTKGLNPKTDTVSDGHGNGLLCDMGTGPSVMIMHTLVDTTFFDVFACVGYSQGTVSNQLRELAGRDTSISGLESRCRELGLVAEQQQHRLEHFEVRPNKSHRAATNW